MQTRPYVVPQALEGELRKFLNEHLDKGYIVPSTSPYASPFFFLKKSDGKWRPVQNYQELNKHTVRDTYAIPQIRAILDALQGSTLFTKFDIWEGYNNIRIKPEDCWKAAFITPMGTFEPRVMYFGQMNAPATFVKNMDHILRTLKSKYPNNIFIYMDDILVATSEVERALHQTIVHELLDILERKSFFLKPWKCVFETNKVSYLGTILDGATFTQDPVKVEGIVNWP